MREINLQPTTLDEAKEAMALLYMDLLETQALAIERGEKLIALGEEVLAARASPNATPTEEGE